MQLSVRFTIIQRIRFVCTEYAIVGLPVVSLSDGLQLSKGCASPALNMQLSISRSLAYRTVYNDPRDAFLLPEYAVVNIPVVGLSDSLQSSKGCVSPALSMKLLVSQLLAYRTV